MTTTRALPEPARMDLAKLHASFSALRVRQAALHGREHSPFDAKIGEVVFQAATKALADTATPDGPSRWWVVSAPTGSGKSCASAALGAAGLLTDPVFSAAYVVETMKQADEIYRLLTELLPAEARGEVAVWTIAHDARATDAQTLDEHGFVPAARFPRERLREARVVVATHAAWQKEMEAGRDNGVRLWRGERRSMLLIDEEPSLTSLTLSDPEEVDRLRKAVEEVDPEHAWLPVLYRVQERMVAAMREAEGASYAKAELFTAEDWTVLDGHAPGYVLERAFRADGGTARRVASLAGLDAFLRFADAARKGFVFLSRSPPQRFVAYDLHFEASPGCVLLDATADISGTTLLMDGMEHVAVPKVDYGNLALFHLAEPAALASKRMKEITSSAKTAAPYAAWIKRTVLANTLPGEKVLVVTHMKLFEHAYLERATDPARPTDWNGREVSTLHFGSGIGSNGYKDCTAVFVFREFHVPRRRHVGAVLAHRRQSFAAADDIGDARCATMRGVYGEVERGHLMRHVKQLACRGAVRKIGPGGECGSMRLYLSLPLAKLVAARERLFPGSRPAVPVAANDDATGTGRGPKPAERLCRLLAGQHPAGTVLWFSDIEAETGVRSCDVGKALGRPEVATITAEYGWKDVTAVDLGLRRKGRGLQKEGRGDEPPALPELARAA